MPPIVVDHDDVRRQTTHACELTTQVTRGLKLMSVPATGSVTLSIETIWRKTGTRIARWKTRSWSAAVEIVRGSYPLGSVYIVWFIPSAWASAFISARKRASLPATVAASMEATL